MYKNRIRNVVIHEPESGDMYTLVDRVSAFHVDIIERRLRQSDLTAVQKIAVIDKIIENLKSREVNGFIK